MVNITEIDLTHPQLEECIQKHGKQIVNVQGQRIFHNPNEPRPPRGTQIFVGRLPRNVYEDTLVPLFSQAGDIFEMRLMMEFSGYTRGFCFVTYYDEQSAQNAIRSLHTYKLNGSAICVYLSWDNTRLYAHGIPLQVTQKEILDEFKKRFVGVVDVICLPGNGFPHKGWAFIEFDSHNNACSARKRMWPAHLEVWGRKIKVEWAKPKRQYKTRNASTLLMHNIPRHMTSGDIYFLVREHLKNNALLAISHRPFASTARLEFSTPNNAAYACCKLNGIIVHGMPLMLEQMSYMRDRRSSGPDTKENHESFQFNAAAPVFCPINVDENPGALVRGGTGDYNNEEYCCKPEMPYFPPLAFVPIYTSIDGGNYIPKVPFGFEGYCQMANVGFHGNYPNSF